MYGRETEEADGTTKVRSFAASGKLWRDAVVLRDRESGSMWTQHDGHALEGPARERGAKLEMVPSERSTWAVARAEYPSAKVLRKTSGIFGSGKQDVYAEYRASKAEESPFGSGGDDRLASKELIFGLEIAGKSLAIPVEALPETGEVSVEVGGQRFMVDRSGVRTEAGDDYAALTIWYFAWLRTHPETDVWTPAPS